MVKVADDDPESVQKAANAFVHHYYHDFLYSFDKIYRFYKSRRVIFRPQYGHTKQNFTIEEMEGIMSPQKYSDVKIKPEDITAESHKLGVEILVYINGQLIGKDKTIQCFSQIFLLEQHKGKKGVYSALYDELTYTECKNEESVNNDDDDDDDDDDDYEDDDDDDNDEDDDDDDDDEDVYPGGFCNRNHYAAEMAGQWLLPKQSNVFQYLESISDGDDDREDVDADGWDFDIWNQSYGLMDLEWEFMDLEPDFAMSRRISELTLDLHNKDEEVAERDTKAFLQSFSSPKSDVIVTVIPGRGKHSKDNKPILLPMVLELLKDLKLNNYILYNLDGAVDITIEKGWLYSPTGYKNSIQISDFFDSSNNSKGASSSNAQVSPSQEEYKIEANDNDGYVGIIKDFASKITCMEKDEISLRMDSSIFHQENTEFFNVFRNDLAAFCNMETVDVTLISAYMRFLFAKYKKSCEIITFLNPASTREELREIICKGSKEMKKKKQKKQKKLLFIPFNITQSKFHWVLIVIDCSSMTVFWVDSSHTKPDILTEFNVKTGLNPLASPDTERPSWKIIKGPMHTNSVRSGYFVMKFMRDLIFTNEQSQSQSIVVKMEKLAEKETYTEEEINLVRAEFIKYILVLGGI